MTATAAPTTAAPTAVAPTAVAPTVVYPAAVGSPGPVGFHDWPAELGGLVGRDWDKGSGGRQDRWVVRGGPGSGKTTLVADVVRAAVTGGVGLDGVLVLTASATAGADLLEEVTSGLPPELVVGTDAPVRTVHSLAHAVVRLAAARVDAPPPRLRTGAEHDALVRETLLGEAMDGAPYWPEQLRPALSTVGFARELRDLLLRSLERGIGPRELARLGRSAGRPAWVAAAGFFRRHEEQMALRSGLRGGESDVPEALNAAELVGAALDALTADPQLREIFRSRRLVVVDDAHHLDPLAAEFVAAVGGGADVLLVVEDGDQSVFRFRGADGGLARAVVDQGGRAVDLHAGQRMAPAVAAVAARIGSRLPGAARHRPREVVRSTGPSGPAGPAGGAAGPTLPTASAGATDATGGDGYVEVTVARSAAAEAAVVADFLRRRHVLDGIDYGEMAVITRSLPRVADALLAALDAAGVPVVDAGAELPPAHDPVVAALLLLLRSALEGADGTDAERTLALLSGPIGRADPIAMRRLRRGIRRSGIGGSEPSAETLRKLVLADEDPARSGVTAVELAPVTRIRHARAAVLDSLRSGGTAEEVLWAAWSASRMERRLVRQAVSADPWSRSADRSLDAVVSLFDHAADYVDRVPGGSVALFCDVVSGEDLPAPRRADTRARGGAVSVLSAHAAVGRQWRSVAVCGVQDGLWPAPRRRSGLLGVDELVDLTEVAGDGPVPSEAERAVSSAAARAAEERRLFYVACSRASSHLLVTAVESPEEGDVAPSRFLDEISDLATAAGGPAGSGDLGTVPTDSVSARYAPTVFTLQHLAVDLRAALLDPSTDPGDAARAAGLLAGLRDAGVEAADPGTWFGSTEPSTTAPPFPAGPDEPVAVLSPSGFGALEECPLRWFLQKVRGDSADAGSSAALTRGSAVHALAQAVEGGISEDGIRTAVIRRADSLTRARGWFAERGAESMVGMAESFRQWRADTRGEYTTAGVEEAFVLDVPGGVRVRGRIDRLEATQSGAVVPVDVKTSPSAVTKAVAAAHPQLALYQLAVAEGAVEAAADRAPGGGLLLYLGGREGRAPTERVQDPLTVDAAAALTERVVEAGLATAGPTYTARVGSWCDRCDVRSSCPAQIEGRQVIE
ncbi:PD-(D/E)XK nuclease family protein [Rhodococcus sp. IEGM 1408]|uniref:PD-(D/E)XK nuclease family protein n=1 Tax=Rhodococcus sp. IEGM 1408 TaxID=3082220 RepID=UPI00295334CC|nr:PD-(D/E)XK nuclease family protein [Rhodococcus sp. IEGM 1408]MDV8000853.1 PD-(D/E)XK nuclease family protein [Rhodococcus sp. IEGM 1408]